MNKILPASLLELRFLKILENILDFGTARSDFDLVIFV